MKPKEIIRTCPLFRKFPNLEGKIPWIAVGTFPTPVLRLKKIGKQAGTKNLWIKREDLSADIYGGNKIRKLEFTLADARSRGAQNILTFGGIGSNHVLATTIYARTLGMNTAAVLTPQPTTQFVRRNLRAYAYYGTEVMFLKNMYRLPKLLLKYPKFRTAKTYILPPGGSNVRGTLGFVSCVCEIFEQVEKGLMPEPKYIWVAGGSGGTVAGLALGVKLCGMKSKIKVVRVVEPYMLNEDIIAAQANKAADLLNKLDPEIPEVSFEPEDIDLLKGYLGAGYGHITTEAEKAMELMEELEGIHLEYTYTGKTAAAMLRNIPYKPKAATLFINTYNSRNLWADLPANLDLSSLPKPLREIAAGKD